MTTSPQQPRTTQPPELLAPGGSIESIEAAVAGGADAVYFGLDSGFNARARATNISVESLPELVHTLHRRGVLAYLTFNTLVFPNELAAAEKFLREAISTGVDTLIVQDLGIARLIREISPSMPIHASTQMTLASAESIQLVADTLGISRAILPREMSMSDIRAIHSQTPVDLEVFVHGALCISYGGQCSASAAIGGRSANRGQCAQPCRLEYELIRDGHKVDLGEKRYLLSPHDLAAYQHVPQLIDAGVVSMKIEGRLKSPEYVGQVTRLYRMAIDHAMAGKPFHPTRETLDEIEQLFSRGFYDGWLGQRDITKLVTGKSSAKQGVILGSVSGVQNQRCIVELDRPIRCGDGVVFKSSGDDTNPIGGRVYHIYRNNQSVQEAKSGRVELEFTHGLIDPKQIKTGDIAWKTDDPQLNARLQKSNKRSIADRRVPLDLTIHAKPGKPLRLTGESETGATCQVESDDPLAVASKHPITEEVLRKQLGRLGKTVFELRQLDVKISGNPMVPLSVLGAMRKEMVRQLDNINSPSPVELAFDLVLPRIISDITLPSQTPLDTPELTVLCRDMSQLEVAIDSGINRIVLDVASRSCQEKAVQIAHRHKIELLLATPRILKPDDSELLQSLAAQGADGLLVRNLTAVLFCAEQQIPFTADASLNAANPITVDYLRKLGADRITPSHDLSFSDLSDLADMLPPDCIEVVLHHHMPMFHMEYCLSKACLSRGSTHALCASDRICSKHTIQLRDRIGEIHPVEVDAACRTTIFSAMAQTYGGDATSRRQRLKLSRSSTETAKSLIAQGVRSFRIELLASNSLEETSSLMQLYSKLI